MKLWEKKLAKNIFMGYILICMTFSFLIDDGISERIVLFICFASAAISIYSILHFFVRLYRLYKTIDKRGDRQSRDWNKKHKVIFPDEDN